MTVCATYGVGQYVASEAHTAIFGRLYKPSTKRPVIFFTGTAGSSAFLTSSASGSQISPRLVDVGIPFISGDFGGANLYGNDTTQTRIGQLWTFVKTLLGTPTDKFIGIGVSKGMTALLNYARANPGNVAALVGIVPGVSLANVYTDNVGLQAGIDAAYTNHASYLAALPTHDPMANQSTHASQGIPMKFFTGDADTVVRPADVQSFGAAVGATVKTFTGTDHLTTAPQVDPVEDVLKFIAPYL